MSTGTDSGRVRHFARGTTQQALPERVELETVVGMSAERVQFIVSGSGTFTVTVDSAKGGLLSSEHKLP